MYWRGMDLDSSYIEMKAALNDICLCLFLIAFTLFVLYIKDFKLPNCYIEAIRTGMILGLVLQILFFNCWGIENGLQHSFRSVSVACLIIYLVIVILTKMLIITNPYKILITFYSSVLLSTIAILISAKRHGYFKN